MWDHDHCEGFLCVAAPCIYWTHYCLQCPVLGSLGWALSRCWLRSFQLQLA